jgi:integrase
VSQAFAGSIVGNYSGERLTMAVTNKLTDSKLRSFKAKEKPYKISDGGGMYVEVRPNGAKWWRLAYRLNGKQQLKSLGVYPEVGLFEARRLRDAFDPSPAPAGQTLEDVFVDFMRIRKTDFTAKHQALMQSRCAPILDKLGSHPIAELRPSDFLPLLREIETRAPSVAKKVRTDFSQCFAFAVASDLTDRNPVRDLSGALKPVKTKHRPALIDPIEVGKFLTFIASHPTVGVVTRLYLQIAPHVFVRPGELRNAKWSDVDFDAAQWLYCMGKVDTDHVVPLSTQVIALLRELHRFTGHTSNLFASVPDEKPISDMTATQILRRSGWADKHCLHGWRATARTLLVERLHFQVDRVEHQLGHLVRDPLGRAYNRTEFLDDRRSMMQQWSDFLESTPSLQAP